MQHHATHVIVHVICQSVIRFTEIKNIELEYLRTILMVDPRHGFGGRLLGTHQNSNRAANPFPEKD